MFKELLSLPVTLTIQTRVCTRQIILLCWTHVPCDVVIKRRIIPMRLFRNFFQRGPQSGLRFFLFESSTYFTVYRGDLMILLHRKLNFSKDPEGVQHFPGGGGPAFSRGVQMLISIDTHITCDFPGGSVPPIPPLDPHIIPLNQISQYIYLLI